MKRSTLLGALLCLTLLTNATQAADVTLTIHNVNEDGGDVRASICDKPNWLTYNCPYRLYVKAKPGDIIFVFKDIPPGTWAAIADHDTNMNGKLDTNFLGIPTEQFGFSNNPGFNHKPDYEESTFTVEKAPVDISIDLAR